MCFLRFSSEFVESRRKALERFLLRVAAHKELNTLSVLIVFLQVKLYISDIDDVDDDDDENNKNTIKNQ